jgi:hypothetical protein
MFRSNKIANSDVKRPNNVKAAGRTEDFLGLRWPTPCCAETEPTAGQNARKRKTDTQTPSRLNGNRCVGLPLLGLRAHEKCLTMFRDWNRTSGLKKNIISIMAYLMHFANCFLFPIKHIAVSHEYTAATMGCRYTSHLPHSTSRKMRLGLPSNLFSFKHRFLAITTSFAASSNSSTV